MYVPGSVYSLWFGKSLTMVSTINQQKKYQNQRPGTYLNNICCLYTGDSKLLIQQFF